MNHVWLRSACLDGHVSRNRLPLCPSLSQDAQAGQGHIFPFDAGAKGKEVAPHSSSSSPYLVGAGVGNIDDAGSLLGLKVANKGRLERLGLVHHVLLVSATRQSQQQAVVALHLKDTTQRPGPVRITSLRHPQKPPRDNHNPRTILTQWKTSRLRMARIEAFCFPNHCPFLSQGHLPCHPHPY